MIKCETLGMIANAKLNPVLKQTADVQNYTFITVDGDLYLVMNTAAGDDTYVDDLTIKAGEYLNGFLVKAWEGQELIADEKHIAYASGKKYSDIEAGTTLLTVDSNGKLAVASAAPTSGVYFKVTGKCHQIGNAVKIKVMVVDKVTA